MKESIVYERGLAHVYMSGVGRYEVYVMSGTASYKKGTFHFPNDPGKALSMAKASADSWSTGRRII